MNVVIEHYQFLSGITGQMREAAMLGEWDQLLRLEQQCSHHVSLMKQVDLAPEDESIRLQKVALINKIFADDAAIRNQTLPWMAKLQHTIMGTRNEQRVNGKYLGNF